MNLRIKDTMNYVNFICKGHVNALGTFRLLNEQSIVGSLTWYTSNSTVQVRALRGIMTAK